MALATARPIPGAVATLGVSDRVAFLRRTYALLGGALVSWVLFTGLFFWGGTSWDHRTSRASYQFSKWALSSGYAWLFVIAAFIAVGYATQALARSQTSRGIQYLGLLLGVIAESVILQPLLYLLFTEFATGPANEILGLSVVITLAVFIGLTLTVFITKKDFSFLRGALMIATFAALGVIVGSLLFGFQLGAIFCGAMVLLMAGYILYQTSLVMQHYPPTHHVSAALMLFSTIATLFWYVLQLVMQSRR